MNLASCGDNDFKVGHLPLKNCQYSGSSIQVGLKGKIKNSDVVSDFNVMKHPFNVPSSEKVSSRSYAFLILLKVHSRKTVPKN